MLSALAPHVGKLKYVLNENSGAILTGVGIAGTVGTAVLTGRASFKAAHVIEEAREAKSYSLHGEHRDDVQLTRTEKAMNVWPLFLPPVAVGALTVTSIFAAHRLDAKKIAALAMATGVSERALQEYKEKVAEKFTEKQATAIQDEVAQDRINANPPSGQVIITGGGDVLCYDMTSGRYFMSSVEKIKQAENSANFDVIHFMECSLSKFYDDLGLSPTSHSDMVGFNINNKCEVIFTTAMSDDQRPCVAIDFRRPPIMGYDNANTWQTD